MKICQFSYNNEIFYGSIDGDSIHPLSDSNCLNLFNQEALFTTPFKIRDVIIKPPVSPSKIICVGRNYADHAAELGNEVPRQPLLFLKAPSSLIMDGEEIIIPKQSKQVEHEGELGVVIGRSCKDLTEYDDPLEYVLGYICLNDVTARDLQRSDVQFTRAKSFDTFCPIGAFVETELDTADIAVVTKVNGVVKQSGRTSQMVFPVPFLLRYISNQMSLKKGDIIATGTPSGVSKLNGGDICTVEIEGIGTLNNLVR